MRNSSQGRGGRPRRVAEEMVRVLSELLGTEIKNPNLGFVTLTGAEVSPDLKNASVFYTALGAPEQQEKTARILMQAQHRLQGEAARRLKLRSTPRLIFRKDETAERALRIERLLKEIRDERKEDSQSG